ncbi:hypothetical protein [Alcaligenes aquatilis]|uniref:hypothetical protein n=1 Tax=Alcaligenes aquatilis TaxID=323284 RepID=UPI003F906761
MRVHICLVSIEAGAIDFVREKQGAIIPLQTREQQYWKNSGATFSASAYNPLTPPSLLPDYLLRLRRSCDVLVLLVDVRSREIVANVAPACFVAHVEFCDWPRTNFANYLAAISAKVLKVLSQFLPIITDGAKEQVVLLPFMAFDAQELRELKESCENILADNFINTATRCIEALRRRRRPHRKKDHPKLYYVDNQKRLFEYGHENHARLATGHPHTSLCVLLGLSRFGRTVKDDRHYNVTREKGSGTKISGNFLNCHGETYMAAAVSHLNIFVNDYRA